MRSKNLVRRVLPISVFVAVLLIQFQNCAKTVGLQNDPMTGSTHSNIDAPIDFSGDKPNGGPIASVNPGNAGSNTPFGLPDCFEIIDVVRTPSEHGSDYYKLILRLTASVRDELDYNRKITKTISVSSGMLVLMYYDKNVIFKVDNGPKNYSQEIEFLIPEEIYFAQPENQLLSGFFTGDSFENFPVKQCVRVEYSISTEENDY